MLIHDGACHINAISLFTQLRVWKTTVSEYLRTFGQECYTLWEHECCDSLKKTDLRDTIGILNYTEGAWRLHGFTVVVASRAERTALAFATS